MSRQNAAVRRLAGCEGKHRFNTFAQARRIAHRQAHRRGEKFAPYACQDCGGFHVGTQTAGGEVGHMPIDGLQPYIVYARRRAGAAEIAVGRSGAPDGGKVAEIIRADGWQVTRISRGGRAREERDPTPWCSGCGAMRQRDCHCGPIAENE